MDGRNLDKRAITNAAKVKAMSPVEQLTSEVDHLFESDSFALWGEKTSIVDSKNVARKAKACLEALIDPTTTHGAKIKISEFICNKLHGVYHLTDRKVSMIVKHLACAVFESGDMPIPLRLYYLRFRNEQVAYHVSANLYNRGIKHRIRLVPYFQILKYLLRVSVDLHDPKCHQIVLKEFEDMFDDGSISLHTKMEIADIFILNGRTEQGHRMIDEIRAQEQVINDTQEHRTVYEDTQNVHTTGINKSVLRACVRLMEIEAPKGFDPQEVLGSLSKVCPESMETITTVLERVEIDTSRFSWEGNLFGLYDVFSSLWAFIGNHENKQDLMTRLVEEIVSMSAFCTTGHVSRFINVIQGYVDDDALQVRISQEQQIIAVVASHLDKELLDSEAMDSIVSDDPSPFYDAVGAKVTELLPVLYGEYEATPEHIVKAIQSYSKWTSWSILDDVAVRNTGVGR